MKHLPTCSGTYALVLRALRRAEIEVGRLGKWDLQRGWYVYVGSALGPGGLRARVSRHAQVEKTRRWHVDYVRAVTELQEVWFASDATRRECQWAGVLQSMPRASIPAKGLGSSDCGCPTHLYFSTQEPRVIVFRRRLRQAAADHGPVKSLTVR